MTAFTNILIPLDLETDGDRAIGIAASLAALGNLPVELVTVSSPGLDEEQDRQNLERRARENGLQHWTATVLHDDDPARAIAEHVASMATPLVVMATSAPGPLGELFAASVTADVLSRVKVPVLVVGPHVAGETSLRTPTLLSCIHVSDHDDSDLDVMSTWWATFQGQAPWFLEVLPTSEPSTAGNDVSEASYVHNHASRLAARGVTAEWEVLHGHDSVAAVESFATKVADPVLMVASERWREPARVHLRSMARRLAHDSGHPVLVVPRMHEERAAGFGVRVFGPFAG